MKNIFIILLTLFAYSCENTPNDLKGVWIGGYNAEKKSDNDSLYVNGPLKELFEIGNDSIYFKTFRSLYNERIDTIKSYSFSFENNVLYYGNDSLVFEQITKDSVVVINNFNQSYCNVYKRVEIETSPNVDFSDDLYAIELGNWNDTLEFIDNGRVLRVNDRDAGDGRSHNWYISSYKNLKFFVVVGQFDIPYLISGTEGDNIDIQFYYDNINYGSMKKLVDFDGGRQLIGDWKMIESKNILNLLPCFENKLMLNINDSIARLKIEEDTLTVNQFGLERTISFWKDKTSRHLFLDTEDTTYSCTNWEIDWRNDSVIDLTTNSWSYNNVTFTRVSKVQ